jgi:nitroimidazol reductase NimA-like FMN-containing flavoprotein (pyridoxamine 5'-phosphate oxidase superfamily)
MDLPQWPMRRADRAVTRREEIDAIIEGSPICHLALAVAGEPYVVPVAFGYDGQDLYIHTAQAGKKIDFMEANNRVCLQFERNVRLIADPQEPCRWGFAFESVIGLGRIYELCSPEAKAGGLAHIMRHYSDREWQFDPAALAADQGSGIRVWRIAIESLTGKRAPSGET